MTTVQKAGAASFTNPLNDVEDDAAGGKNTDQQAATRTNSDPFTPPKGPVAWVFWPVLDENEAREWLELKRSGAASLIMHPESNFRKYWDLFSMVLIIYSCITIPYRLGFSVEPTDSQLLFDRVVDLIFMIDCGLTFRTAIFIDQRIVVDSNVIAKTYAKGWLFLDFFSSFPFDVLLDASGSSDNPDAARILKLIRIFRMIKILRMVRIKRLLKKFQDEMSIKNGVMISLKFAIITIMASHFLACLWFSQSTGNSQNNWALKYCVWADKDSYNDDCGLDVCRVQSCEAACGGNSRDSIDPATLNIVEVSATAEIEECLDECVQCNPSVQYTASIYYALVTMTTIGYGDVLPTNDSERIFASVAMLIGASIFAYAITNMCQVVHNLNPADVAVKSRMDDLTDLINFLGLNRLLRHKIMENFFYKTNTSGCSHNNEEAILKDMSRAQRQEIVLYTVRKYIEAVPVFRKYNIKDPDPQKARTAGRVLGRIASHLSSSAFAPGDRICQQGTHAFAMFMVAGGHVSVRQNLREIAVCGDGCCLATTVLFRSCKYMYTAITTDFTDVYALKRDDFQLCIRECGESLNGLEAFAVEQGLTASDIADFTVSGGYQEWIPFKDPRTEEQLETDCKTGISELKRRIRVQEKYIALLTDSISGMS